MNRIATAAAAALGLCALTPATAAVSTWTFDGACWFGQCSADATATLTLTDYVPGTDLTGANFVSLSYSSDAPLAFTIDASGLDYIWGRLGGEAFLPGLYSVEVDGTDAGGNAHFLGTNGIDGVSWNADNVDVGIPFSWTTASVPEPASWALMLGGFGMVGGALRHRRARVRFA